MDVEIGKKWVAALRSGKYPQTKKMLKATINAAGEGDNAAGTRYGFCCLGVLCDVIGKDPENEAADNSGEQLLTDDTLGETDLTAYEQTILAEMNDEGGRTFSQIADYIEQNLIAA